MRRSIALANLLVVFLGSSALAPAQSKPVVTAQRSLETIHGKITVRYKPVALPAKSLQDHQDPGTVWSMSDDEAAVLETDFALAYGTQLLPPGKYRLSSWYRKKGDWQLLVFERGKNYRSGTPYRGVPLQVHDLPRATEVIRIELVERRGVIRLQLFGGTTRLRAVFEPIEVVQHKGTIAGQPATFEFYRWNADFRIQNRLREYHLVQLGRVRRDGKFGALYDISVKSDGNGIFVMCHSDTLAANRELLVQKTKALRDRTASSPGWTDLQSDIAELQAAIAEQKELQPSVMLPGTVVKVKEKAKTLVVEPVLDSDGTSFELSFGIRKAKFTLNESQFRKLQWK